VASNGEANRQRRDRIAWFADVADVCLYKWADMFAVAGLEALPNQGKSGVNAAGPNQVLADAMGVIYSTSHQEPMAR
jgi:hypothetical protein